jgi:hypothetical protein
MAKPNLTDLGFIRARFVGARKHADAACSAPGIARLLGLFEHSPQRATYEMGRASSIPISSSTPLAAIRRKRPNVTSPLRCSIPKTSRFQSRFYRNCKRHAPRGRTHLPTKSRSGFCVPGCASRCRRSRYKSCLARWRSSRFTGSLIGTQRLLPSMPYFQRTNLTPSCISRRSPCGGVV